MADIEPTGGDGLPTEFDGLWPTRVEVLEGQLSEAQARERKQALWLVGFGVTPASILPIAVALGYDQGALAGLMVVVAIVLQAVRWYSARGTVAELRQELDSAKLLEAENLHE